MISLTINLPEEAFSALRVDPHQFAAEMRFAAAVQWYHQGLISGSKAAEIAGMPRLVFLDELARRRLDTVKIDLGDLEAAGFTFGTVGELFGLTEAEEELIEMKVAVAEAIRDLREAHSLSQADLARLIGSGQARVSKLERSSESTSLDTLFRCMLVLGATRQDLAKAISHSTQPKKPTGKPRITRKSHAA